MIQARRSPIGQGVECQVEGTTVEIVGELTAMIEAVRAELVKNYDTGAVDETIVNIGKAAYAHGRKEALAICKPLIKDLAMRGGQKQCVM